MVGCGLIWYIVQGWLQQVDEHQRRVCGSEGSNVHAVEHSECARGDIQLQGGRGVGVSSRHGRDSIRCMQELRGGWW